MNVLHVIPGGTSYGGIENFICNMQNYMNGKDVENSILSIWSFKNDEMIFDIIPKIYTLNCENNYVSLKEKINLLKKFIEFFKGKHWDIVHVHGGILYAFMLSLVLPKDISIICHIHVKNIEQGRLFKIKLFLIKNIVLKRADYIFGCSKEAIKSWLGEEILHSSKCRVIPNAVEIDKLSYNPSIREKIRNTDCVVFGYVSRMVNGKNHMFLIDVFDKIHSKRKDTELWLVGDGENENTIRQYVKKLNLNDSVKFFGGRNDVNELLQAMDAFVFPSQKEGFGIVAIEAQAAGLPVYASDGVPMEVAITDLVRFIPLSETADSWADCILEDIEKLPNRTNNSAEIKKAGYDVKQSAEYLRKLYINLFNGRGNDQ